MSSSLETGLLVAVWAAVILLLTAGLWFLRRHHLLHITVGILLTMLGAYLVVRLRELLLMLLLAGVLAFMLNGPVERLSRRIRRPLAIGLVYLALVSVLVLAGCIIIPTIVREVRHLIRHLPEYQASVQSFIDHYTTWFNSLPDEVQNGIN